MLPKIGVSLRKPAARAGELAGDSPRVVGTAPLLVAATIVAWVVITALRSSGQWGDHFEQFVWAHGLEWGYHKHPPLPTWLLAATIDAFGPGVYWADALAAACFVGTVGFTWGIARELLGRPSAALAVLMLSLHHSFSARASLFNHNSVMLLTVSAAAWLVLRALKPGRHEVAWALAGVAAALAVLSKYQAVVPLAGIVLGAWRAGELAPPAARRGLAVAVLVALALLTPHLLWLSSHATVIDYATQQGRSLDGLERALNVGSFLVQQLRYLIGPLLFFGLLAVMPGPRAGGVPGDGRRQRAWLVGLVAFPLCVTVLTGPLFGIALQNHWGYQALQFASLWLAWRLRPLAPAANARWVVVALALHVVLIAVSIAEADIAFGKTRPRVDGRYPAQALADAVAADWKDDTLCPLRLVVGPTFEAGIVSVYNGGTAQVLEDGSRVKSPWVAPGLEERYGAVYLAAEPSKLPVAGAATVNWLDVGVATPKRVAPRIYWAIVPPERCDGP